MLIPIPSWCIGQLANRLQVRWHVRRCAPEDDWVHPHSEDGREPVTSGKSGGAVSTLMMLGSIVAGETGGINA